MRKLFVPKSPSFIGVDFHEDSLALVEIFIKDDRCHLHCAVRESLPAEAMEGHCIKNISLLSQSIAKALQKGTYKSKHAVLALPDSLVIRKVLEVSTSIAMRDMEACILLQTEQLMADSLEEISIDFETLGASTLNPAMQQVLVFAARTRHIEQRVAALQKAGLRVKAVDVASLAIERTVPYLLSALPFPKEKSLFAIIDVRMHNLQLYVLEEGKVIYSREEALPLLMERAVSAHLSQEQILATIQRLLHFFYSTTDYKIIQHLMLAGDEDKLASLVPYIKENVKIATTIARLDFFTTLASASFIIASGLALKAREMAF